MTDDDAGGLLDERSAARATRGIFIGVVVATCGSYAAMTLAPVAAHAITGSAFMAGLPVAALLAGAGVGATGVARMIARHGYQRALAGSYLLAALGCLVGLLAVAAGSFALLMVGMAVSGVGQASNQLARYAAAELHPEHRRPAVIGWMVWALAVGAIVGPLSAAPAGGVAVAAGLHEAAGGFLVGAVLLSLAAGLHLLGPRFRVAALAESPVAEPVVGDARPWALPTVQIAVATMVTSVAVMLLVMTVTPVHVHSSGHGVADVGAIMSAHTLGMFALAPIAGWLTARLGGVPVILAGFGVLAFATALGAVTPASSQIMLGVALFALGFGWCLSFVAASALLTHGLTAAVRVPLQGRVESLRWVIGGAAAVGSGLLLGLVGYAGLNVLAAMLLAIPLAFVVVYRGVIRAGAPAS